MKQNEQYKHDIHTLLNSLGIGRQYRGYFAVATAVNMVFEHEEYLYSLGVNVFSKIAVQMGIDDHTVNRNIRTVVHRAWLIAPEKLIAMAGYKLRHEPTVIEFIEMLYSYLLRQYM